MVVEIPPIDVYRCTRDLINDGWCDGHVEGSLSSAIFYATSLKKAVERDLNMHEQRGRPAINVGGDFNWNQGSTVAAGNITQVCEHIVPFEISVSPELMTSISGFASSYRSSEEERNGLLEKIDTLDVERGGLRRIFNKNEEEKNRLAEVSSQLLLLTEGLEKIEIKMTEDHKRLNENLSQMSMKTVESITLELQRQSAKMAQEVVSSNKELFQLIDSASILLNGKLDAQKEDLEKIANLIELNDQHLKVLVGAIDGQQQEKKTDLRQQVTSLLKNEISAIKDNPQEAIDLINRVFDEKNELTERTNCLRSFLNKSKDWLKKNPQTVLILKTLLFGTITYFGVQTPKI